MNLAAHDAREGYCRTLGHAVPFKYCRTMSNGLPCRLIADCWHERFDVAAWLATEFSPQQLAHILTPPKSKMTSLIELIEEARKRAGP